MWAIIAHGGAGNIHANLADRHRGGCLEAIRVGAEMLDGGASALDAVCAVVRVLEDNPLYNAGLGGALDALGVTAMDASVMRGEDLGYGAVAAVTGVLHPVDLARAVLEDGQHSLLVGPHALDFARARRLCLVDPALQVTMETERAWQRRVAEERTVGRPPPTVDWTPELEPSPGTVGAAALDAAGNLAAATSTGGLLMRYPGRVGDSPIAGAGVYADNRLGAISATGHGESMMRMVFGYRAVAAMAEKTPDLRQEILLAVLDEVRDRVGGRGGAISVHPDGKVTWARNTRAMGCAWQRLGEAPETSF